MNEYTRREEVRWMLVASATLVLCIAAALALLLSAKGKLVPDANARAAAKAAEAKTVQAHTCVTAAERLMTEIEVFKASAKAARLKAEEPDAGAGKKRPKKKAEKAPDVELAWPAAQPSYKQAKALAPCRATTDAATGPKQDAGAGWDAVVAASNVNPPSDDDKPAQIEAARKLLAALGEAPVDKVLAQTKDAEAALKDAAEKESAAADKATVREPLPKGLFAREMAIGIGVALAVVSLLLSFMSVRVASRRRMTTLVPLREVATTPQRGLQAAAILRLAAQHNGGEPGIVLGAALGGLLAAAIFPADTDLFVAGVMSGLLLGLGLQWALRLSAGASRWRARAAELGEIEKPTIPIVLVLSGVNQGLEQQFLSFFAGLAPADAAATVEKLAAQAEERILAAAEAGAAQRPPQPYPQGPAPQGQGGGGYPFAQ